LGEGGEIMKPKFDIEKIKDLRDLYSFMKTRGIKYVTKTPSQMCGFEGLHIEDEDWGLKIPRNTIWMSNDLTKKYYFVALRHEVEELCLMQDEGLKYWPAHKIATRHEKKWVKE
jgi:hypothetical protein